MPEEVQMSKENNILKARGITVGRLSVLGGGLCSPSALLLSFFVLLFGLKIGVERPQQEITVFLLTSRLSLLHQGYGWVMAT